MTFQEFRRLRLGDEVYSHFGNAYRCAVVTELFDRHLRVEADAVKGGKLTRIAKYKSVDTRDTGRLRQGRSVFACAYCGGNDEDPQDHCMDCARPVTPNTKIIGASMASDGAQS